MVNGKIAIFVALTVLSSIGIAGMIAIYGFNHTKENNRGSGITAFEGRKNAENIAHNWNENVTLIYITGSSAVIRDGRFSQLTYRYWNGENTTGNVLSITVHSDGHTTTRITNRQYDEWPIEDVTIDTPTIISIAKSDSQVSAFLSKYSDASVDSFFLAYSNFRNTSVWTINWVSLGFMDDPHNARAIIDAYNGAVLNVEAQME